MSFFQFQNPEYFFLLLLLPIIAWWAGRMGPEAAMRFSSTSLVKAVSRSRRSLPGRFLIGLRILALVALITALARPQMGKMNDTTDADGIDIVVTLDLSGSMRALDLSTQKNIVTRLDAAKKVVREFIEKRPYDRIGLVAFAADAYVVSPLTLNHDWLKKNLDRLELGEIDGAGTAIGTALGASVNRLRDHEARSHIVILLTDGENNAGQITPIGAAEAAKSWAAMARSHPCALNVRGIQTRSDFRKGTSSELLRLVSSLTPFGQVGAGRKGGRPETRNGAGANPRSSSVTSCRGSRTRGGVALPIP